MSTVFVCHFYSCDPDRSRAAVSRIARQIAAEGHLPLVPQLFLPAFIDEATERNLALKLCLQLLALADEVRVYGEPSEGMRREIEEAERLGIPVVAGDLP